MSIMKIAFSPTIKIELKHPVSGDVLVNTAGKKMTVEAYGAHTPEFRNSSIELKRISLDNETNGADPLSNEAYSAKLLAPCIKRFNNLELETENGLVDPADIEGTLISVFWIREQIEKDVVQRGLFIA